MCAPRARGSAPPLRLRRRYPHQPHGMPHPWPLSIHSDSPATVPARPDRDRGAHQRAWLGGELGGIAPGKAGVAERMRADIVYAECFEHLLFGQVGQRVGADTSLNLGDTLARGDQLRAVAGIDAIV